MNTNNLSQKKIIQSEISIAFSDWDEAGQPLEDLLEDLKKSVMKIIDINLSEIDKCEKCYKKLPEGSEYYQCRLIDNMGLSVSKKVCVHCFEIYILNTAG